MIRRHFIKSVSQCALGGLGVSIGLSMSSCTSNQDVIIGHGNHKYKVDLNWGNLDQNRYPVNDCHEMAIDSKGRIILLTNHTKNNVIIYDQMGNLQEVWGTEFPGAHGLTLNNENGLDYLYITDTERHEVIKTSIDGKVIQIIEYPNESGLYASKDQYLPTETAIASNGDIYVADGYGLQYILHYDSRGNLINTFGGYGEEDESFTNAHGIAIDNRTTTPTLLITDRMKNQLKSFSLDGKLINIIDLPGAYICRPVIHKTEVYLATIWSGDGSSNTGFISILDQKNKLISAPGGNKPTYLGSALQPMCQVYRIFHHPHDVCIDDNDNIYIAQWNSGRTYPIKLVRI